MSDLYDVNAINATYTLNPQLRPKKLQPYAPMLKIFIVLNEKGM